ncbi:class I SAM-dependent methyltransferase [Longispora sp. NPDC051575]|uniref:class I SAM-dependent methyltransferase n=1 Tax=Longispora sp. NPDC051575 TaxID=3154943 RepID=UPI00344ACF57
MDTPAPFDLAEFYDAYPRVEEEFQADLDESLDPSGPELLYDLVADLGLPARADVLDVGCGEGGHSLRLADRFGCTVRGFDPVARHVELARAELAGARPELRDQVSFAPGSAGSLPVPDASADLVWCRDVLVHVTDLDAAYAEFRRVLRDTGRVLVYQMFGTARLEPREAGWLFGTMGVVPSSADPGRTESAIASAGLRIDTCRELGTEWGEFAEERTGNGGRQLLHAARLLREPGRYAGRYGQGAYDIMLGDCLWHVYRMIGKLSPRVYVLSVA